LILKLIRQKITFFEYVSIYKIYNLILNIFSFVVSILLNKTLKMGLPISMSIEPTNTCNLKCPECPVGMDLMKRGKGQIDIELYKKIINQTSNYLISLNLYFQGEPFLNKNIFEMIKYASSKKIYTIISTNAQLINQTCANDIINSKLNEIIISIDGATPEIYEKYRKGANFQKVLNAIKFIQEAKNKAMSVFPIIKIQFIVFKYNQHEIQLIKQIATDLKVDKTIIKTAQIYNYQSKPQLIPDNKKYSRYLIKNNKVMKKNKMYNFCWRFWSSNVVTIDGFLVPCCFDKDEKYILGNLKTQTIKEVIKGKKYKTFATKIIQERKNIDICNNCN